MRLADFECVLLALVAVHQMHGGDGGSGWKGREVTSRGRTDGGDTADCAHEWKLEGETTTRSSVYCVRGSGCGGGDRGKDTRLTTEYGE